MANAGGFLLPCPTSNSKLSSKPVAYFCPRDFWILQMLHSLLGFEWMCQVTLSSLRLVNAQSSVCMFIAVLSSQM